VNILFVSRCLPLPPLSGDRVILHNLARQLHARGHTLDLLGFFLEGDSDPREGAGDEFASVTPIRERPRSPLDYLVRLGRIFPGSAEECWNPMMWEAIERQLGAREYAVVHFLGGVQVYEFRAALPPTLPTVIEPYDSYARNLETAQRRVPRSLDRLRLKARSAVARRYERSIYRGFGRVILVTENDAAFLRKLAPGLPAIVIPNGVDADFFQAKGETPGPPVLTFVGNYAYPPNADAAARLVMEILPRVKAEVAGASALIIGPNPPPALRALAGADVEVTGWVPDVRPHLSRSRCFVSPLRSGTGMRNKIMEAMAMGVPVVATLLSCEGIRVTDGETVLLGETVAELSAGAVRLLREGSLHHRMARSARNLVLQEHTWTKVAEQYETAYQAVISERRRERMAGAAAAGDRHG
jgi:glycosyltransferase involved in cell wall biosynthesis